MAKKLTEYTNPVNGKTGNIFNFGDIWGSVLGVVFFLTVFAIGEKAFGFLSGKSGGFVGQPTDPFARPQAPQQGPTGPTIL